MRHPALLLGAALLALSPGGAAHHDQAAHQGTIHLSTTGILASMAPCDTDSPLNGLDGHWIAIDGFAGHGFQLNVDPRLDGFLQFYSPQCLFVGGWNAHGPGQPESGLVPEHAEYVLVSGYIGHPSGSGGFTLTLA